MLRVVVFLCATGMLAWALPTPDVRTREESYESGKRKLAYQYYVRKDGTEVRHGSFTAWHENGQTSMSAQFAHGKPTGVFESWHENGSKKVEIEADENKGRERVWYECGQRKSETIQDDDKYSMTEWYPSGTNKTAVKLLDGTGTVETWFANGKPSSLMPIRGGEPHGLARCWDNQGRLLAEGRYDQGRRVAGKFVRWSKEGGVALIESADKGLLGRVHVVAEYDPVEDRKRVLRGRVSDDPTYGYTRENPVKLGGGLGPEASRVFLRHLRTPAMEPFDFWRVGNVGTIPCDGGEHVIDHYGIVARDGSVTNSLYIDMYHPAVRPLDALAPKGLLLIGSEKEWTPTLQRRLDEAIKRAD